MRFVVASSDVSGRCRPGGPMREGLLARVVLSGCTRGYRHHPQLERFRQAEDALSAINFYLAHVLSEARQRGYRFDPTRINTSARCKPLEVSVGQLLFERRWLLEKLRRRLPQRAILLRQDNPPRPHPLFRPVPGPKAQWEKSK